MPGVGAAKMRFHRESKETCMSTPSTVATQEPVVHEPDAVEAIVPLIPLVLPMVGAVLIFLLAFIAVFMA